MDQSDTATKHEEMARDIALREHQVRLNQSQSGQTFSQCFDEWCGEEVVCYGYAEVLSDEHL
ncbi:MAG: hypothetical protein Rpha_1831 [Candidatus Ruthia sp. Apha_13_S6]|nr:hypothetical protein [Candidatus Ruthia sp. Apha_13_S6]